MKTLIYGGTFNPAHIGHINLAKNAKDFICPDKMLLIPSFIPPHKQQNSDIAEGCHRFNMAKLAAEDIGCEVSDIELKRNDISYSVYTLEELKKQGCENIHFLMGSDMFLCLEKWFRFEDILKLCTPVTAPRKKDELDILNTHAERLNEIYRAKSIVCDFSVIDISSTQLRNRIRAKEDVSSFLTSKIEEYISKNGLYR